MTANLGKINACNDLINALTYICNSYVNVLKTNGTHLNNRTLAELNGYRLTLKAEVTKLRK